MTGLDLPVDVIKGPVKVKHQMRISAGPIFWTDANGDEIIVAVTSTGDAQCVATGLDYRVDVRETLDWVYSQFP